MKFRPRLSERPSLAASTFLALALLAGCETTPPASTPAAEATPASPAPQRGSQAEVDKIVGYYQAGEISYAAARNMLDTMGRSDVPLPTRAPAPVPTPAPTRPVAPVARPAAPAVPASPLAGLPSYRAQAPLAGRLRSVGSDSMDKLMEAWESAFRREHPNLQVLHQGKGSGTAIPALIEGTAEVGPMSRAVQPSEIQAFSSRLGYEPTTIRVALDALGIYVHPDNPIVQRGLSLAELDAIFSSTRARGAGASIDTWGQLGLTGEWADAPIVLHGRNRASGTFGYFKDEALKKGEFKPSLHEQVGSAEVVRAVAGDKFAIGYSGIGYKTASVATVPLRRDAQGTPIDATEANATSGSYPLARYLYLVLSISPNQRPSALQREFISFVLSRDGQELVVKDGYFPISPAQAATELAKLGVTNLLAGQNVPEEVRPLGAYQPMATLNGRLRSVGSDTMDNMMALWERGFTGYHASLRVMHQGKGSGTAIPSLIEGSCEVAPMSRLIKPDEKAAFRARYGYDPVELRVAVDTLAIYVHPENPLLQRGLSLSQLDAIFSSTRNRGATEEVVTWGQLGLTGEWADAPIQVYSRNRASGTYGTFKDRVLSGGEFKASNREVASSEEVVAAVASNKFAIGYSGIGYKTPQVRTLALARADGERYVQPSKEAAFDGSYALARSLYLVVNYDPAKGLDALTREFVRYVFSAEGQAVVLQDGYYPVNATIKAAELKKVGLE